jgi:hypothetical protein
MQATGTGHGYWLLTQDGHVYPFGDASTSGDIGGCSNYGNAARLLATPDSGGYWIATSDGAIVPFGDATKLGFPATTGGPAVALLGAN